MSTANEDERSSTVNDDEMEALRQLYAEAWDEGIFVVEWPGLAAAGRVSILRQLEQQTGRKIDYTVYQTFGPGDCLALGMLPGSGASRLDACRQAIAALKQDEQERAAAPDRPDQVPADAPARPLAHWDAQEARSPSAGPLVWWSRLDARYQVEVQRTGDSTARLAVFDHLDRDRLVGQQVVSLRAGAVFGPDVEDLADWQDAAAALVDGRTAETPPAADEEDGS
ncbi:MAG TPA: hypothetical protein VMU90_14595 [Solirubrobacteraceae bacterium]|nr:hypothetical protein [Solirubrobacteraceae bacterium]